MTCGLFVKAIAPVESELLFMNVRKCKKEKERKKK